VRLDRLCAGRGGVVFAKLENFNPGLSKKDRIAKSIVLGAKRTGVLKDGQTVVEMTSGNTGTGLAIVCAVLGHPFVAVMSEGNSKERVDMMRSLGARVELVPQLKSNKNQVSGADLELVKRRASELKEELDAFEVDQFFARDGVAAHFEETGAEILDQTNGEFDAFVDFVGTGGTFAGCAKRFKQFDPSKKCYVVEPESVAILSHALQGQNNASIVNNSLQHKIQGGGYGMPDLLFVQQAYEQGLVDGFLQISDEQALETTRALAKSEGIIGGFSSGANIAAALQLIDSGEAERVVALVCDSGMKYMSTDLFTES